MNQNSKILLSRWKTVLLPTCTSTCGYSTTKRKIKSVYIQKRINHMCRELHTISKWYSHVCLLHKHRLLQKMVTNPWIPIQIYFCPDEKRRYCTPSHLPRWIRLFGCTRCAKAHSACEGRLLKKQLKWFCFEYIIAVPMCFYSGPRVHT